MVCEVEMGPSIFISPEDADKRRFVTTKPLVAIDRLRKQGVPLDSKVGDWSYLKREKTSGTRHRRFQIIETVENMKYKIRNKRGERIVSASYLESPCLDHKSVPGTVSLPETLSSTSLLVFKRLLGELDDALYLYRQS